MDEDNEPLSNEEAAERIAFFLVYHGNSMPADNFDTAFTKSVTVRSARVSSPGVNALAVFAFKVPRTYSNRPFGEQTTHGGAIATFFDWLTSMTVVANDFPGWESTGLTRRLDVTYFKPIVEGDDVLLEGEVLQIGKRTATIRGTLRRERDGVLLATCQHDKVLVPERPDSPPPPSTKL